MEIVLPILVTVGIIVAILGTQMGSSLDPVQARLQQIAVRPRSLEELELQRPLSDRTLKPIIRGLASLMARFYPANTMKALPLKLKRAGMEQTSAEFFLGVKAFAAIVGAIAVSAIVNLLTSDPTQTLVGTAVSFVVAYAAIAWLLRFVAHHSIAWFVPYRVALGLVLLGLLAGSVITAT